MNDDTFGSTSNRKPKTDRKRLRTMTDDEVHAAIAGDPDIHPTHEAFWRNARVVMPRLRPP